MKNEILSAIDCLQNGIVKKLNDNVFALPNAVVYRQIVDNSSGSIKGLKYIEEILAIKTKSGVILGNSSRLDKLENMYSSYQGMKPNKIQEALSVIIPMIPFSVFKEAELDLFSCEIVDAGNEETLKEKVESWNKKTKVETIRDRHFTGARLFKAQLKNVNHLVKPNAIYTKELTTKYFLCDVDRREIKHNIINFFLAELPKKCGTISEAYDMLKPEEVKQAELNNVPVFRQGEFFFIKSIKEFDDMKYVKREYNQVREIRVGNSRPNSVEKGINEFGVFYVQGNIEHTGREHYDLNLGKRFWFKVVPNTSKANFQLTGDID